MFPLSSVLGFCFALFFPSCSPFISLHQKKTPKTTMSRVPQVNCEIYLLVISAALWLYVYGLQERNWNKRESGWVLILAKEILKISKCVERITPDWNSGGNITEEWHGGFWSSFKIHFVLFFMQHTWKCSNTPDMSASSLWTIRKSY